MTAKIFNGRKAPATRVAPAATVLFPGKTMQIPARTLSGAFAAALGEKPQMPHLAPMMPQEKGPDSKTRAGEAGAPPVKKSRPGKPTLPRQGHR